MKALVISIAVIAVVFYVALQILSGAWTFEHSTTKQTPAPIIKGPNYNEVGSAKSQKADPWLGTISTEPAFLENRRFRNCGPRCAPEEIDSDGTPVPYDASREKENPLCSEPIYDPETFDLAFAQNEIRAEARYGTGCWRLKGRIAGIETSFVGGARFQLYGPTGVPIQCHVDESYTQQFSDLNPGDHVVIKAVGPSRIMGGVAFRSCKM